MLENWSFVWKGCSNTFCHVWAFSAGISIFMTGCSHWFVWVLSFPWLCFTWYMFRIKNAIKSLNVITQVEYSIGTYVLQNDDVMREFATVDEWFSYKLEGVCFLTEEGRWILISFLENFSSWSSYRISPSLYHMLSLSHKTFQCATGEHWIPIGTGNLGTWRLLVDFFVYFHRGLINVLELRIKSHHESKACRIPNILGSAVYV